MSAEIIAFPLKAPSCIDQQRWIPTPPPPRRTADLPILGYLRICGILIMALASWGLILGAARLMAFVL
jgi:hypothetical protein